MIDVDVKVVDKVSINEKTNYAVQRIAPVVNVSCEDYRVEENPVRRHILDLLEADIRNAIVNRLVQLYTMDDTSPYEVTISYKPEEAEEPTD